MTIIELSEYVKSARSKPDPAGRTIRDYIDYGW